MAVVQSLSQTMEGSGLQTFLIVPPYHKKNSEHTSRCMHIYL